MTDFDKSDSNFNKSESADLPLAADLRKISMGDTGIENLLQNLLEEARKRALKGELIMAAYLLHTQGKIEGTVVHVSDKQGSVTAPGHRNVKQGISDAGVELLFSELKVMGYKCNKGKMKRASDIGSPVPPYNYHKGGFYCIFWDIHGDYTFAGIVSQSTTFHHISISW